MTFTDANWNLPQTVTVTGLDDDQVDGNIPYTVILAAAASADTNYNGLDPADVAVTNLDNDTAGVTVSTISGDTDEDGTTATFTVVLDSQPSADVTIDISSNDATEGTVSPAPPLTLTFTDANWNLPQTVTVTGQDDDQVDGNVPYSVILAAAASADTNYNGLDPADVAVTNLDNDTAGVTVSTISGDTDEDGTTATFTVVLDSQPSADVTIDISSNDATEGTVSPAPPLTLTFTDANWNLPQTVTVTGQDDDQVDGNVPYSVILAAAASADTNYNGLDPADVAVTNLDNDTAGVTVSTISGDTDEDGTTATFTVVLDSQPSADVTIDISSNDATEGTVSPAPPLTLTFTDANWNLPQTVTVTGQDDDQVDGNVPYSVILAAAASADTNYNGLDPADVAVTNLDNDTAGVTVSTISGDTDEDGTTATFTVVLDSQPSADVTIDISSNDATEGTVSPAPPLTLTFTDANWNLPQTVTVTGQDDDQVDGNVPYSVILAAAASADTNYNGLDPADVAVTNLDNDTAGVTVSTISGDTDEDGTTATFTVVLDSQPSADVTIDISSNDATEGTVSPAPPLTLTFTDANWNLPQTVTVTGQDDDQVDGNVPYSVILAAAASADTNYNGLDPADVAVTNLDNDTAGVTVSTISGDTDEDGTTATFTVVLDSQPSADVTIDISSNDATEGTVSPAPPLTLTFTDANWNLPQTVTVTGQDDDQVDGNVPYSVILAAAASADTNYNGLDPADVAVTNLDNDTAGVTVSTISGDTDEDGTTATFTVVLDSQPSADVTIDISSNDATEGTVSPAPPLTLTFTDANWNLPQTVTVTGQDDDQVDGNVPYSVILAAAASADTNYNGLDPADVAVTNLDNDTAGVTVSTISGDTDEDGTTATFTVVLDSQPSADVTIDISSNDATEGTVSPAPPLTLTFTDANWNLPQTVTVTGQDDDQVDGNVPYSVILAAAASADTNYNGLDPADVAVTNLDNDTAGVTVSTISGDTDEDGTTATFTVVLDSQPSADVTIDISSNDATEGTVSPAPPLTLTFTDANWNLPQTVTVTGQDDDQVDGNVPYSVILAAAASADTNYNGLDPADVAVTNLDNDTAGVTVSTISGDTDEDGTTATFTVVLDSQPSADVTIDISSNDATEGTVSPAPPLTLTFTDANWNLPQTVTVTGQDDDQVDGNVPYSVILAAAASADTNYNGLDPADVAVTNLDNDTAGVTVSTISGDTDEDGTTATFTVVLDSQPSADVTIDISSNDATEGTVSPAPPLTLTFTDANWNLPQTVTVTGQDDDQVDGNVPYSVILAAAASADTNYNGLDPADVAVTNLDNDTAGVTVSTISGDTDEDGTTATFTVVLDSQPSADVTIDISSNDATEGTVSPAPPLTLTFTDANWNLPQTVTVTGQDDDQVDGNVPYSVILAAAASADTNYNGLDPADVAVTNLDNDTAGVTVSTISGDTDEDGTTATFTVVLDSQPSADVTIDISSNDATEGTVSPAPPLTLTFTDANWNLPQTVTVTGQDDDQVDGNVPYSVILAAAASADTNYNGLDPADVAVTNLDNDTAGVTVSTISGDTDEDGTTATFTVVLDSQPSADVTIDISSNDATEGTVSPAPPLTLTFTDANWNLPQTVTVTGQDDDQVDGNVPYSVILAAAASADTNYNGLDPADVAVTNLDNDTAGVTVSTISGDTDEDGTTATFTVVLDSQPSADVTIDISSNDATEGTVSPAPPLTLTFTDANWNLPQTVTVTGQDDDQVDGNVPYSVILAAAASADTNYNGLDPADVAVTNLDNDTAGVTVSTISGDTDEDGTTATFTVVLDSQPSADVTIDISSNDATEGTVSPAPPLTLTFTDANWNLPQTVTVTGQDDDQVDGNVPYSVILAAAASADTNYNGLDPADVAVTNLDNDTAGVTVSTISGDTDEDGTTATFTVVLDSQPSADVTIDISSNDATEGTVSPAPPLTLTFTDANWNLPQTVTVTGQDDDQVDGNVPYSVILAAAASADTNYNGLDPADVAVTNLDNDTAGVTVSTISGDTDEYGTTATFTVVLDSQPSDDVTIDISSNDATEGTVSPAPPLTLTFTDANWNLPQTVTVTGEDDDQVDGNIPYSVILAAAASADTNYNGLDPADVSVTNLDNDTAGVTVSTISGDTDEYGTTATFTVVLDSQPSDDVTIAISSNDATEGTVQPAPPLTLTFTDANWNLPQTVTVTGVDDDQVDGNITYAVILAAAASADTNYNGLDPADVSVTNLDNDSAGVSVSTISGDTDESGTTATFTVVLNSQPSDDVTIDISSGDPTEGTVSPSPLDLHRRQLEPAPDRDGHRSRRRSSTAISPTRSASARPPAPIATTTASTRPMWRHQPR